MADEHLEPDEAQLTTGERVRFRLLVKPSVWNPGDGEANIQTSRPLLMAPLEGQAAIRWAHLESILLDIRFARACCHRLAAAAGGRLRLDSIVEGALWRSVLISYRRCFT